jgi:hypothetical protein
VPLVALVIPLVVVLAAIALIPVTLVRRYQVATSRQRARRWLAAVNLVGLGLSSMLFLFGAAVTSFWVPGAFTYSVAG